MTAADQPKRLVDRAAVEAMHLMSGPAKGKINGVQLHYWLGGDIPHQTSAINYHVL
jgi:hypothetical protein